ncbi:DUF2975 domain-containing protein [Bordetella sp. N]|uniref:DUF2975 domain-containing protein n=1 Tax=Bordetella sp. N TaxID=1746199 RepID=UPI00070F3E6F|nr:DUF2975 domain-containing protein [Bordetella sp. N]ALM86365.1 hypothetical protein ASB57_28580 [Bordetella sp. N]
MTNDRLVRHSRRMAAVTPVFTTLILTCNAMACFGLSKQFTNSATDLAATLNIELQDLPGWQLLGVLTLTSIPLLVLAHGLRHLRQLFLAYAHANYFSAAGAGHLQKVSKALLLWCLLSIVCNGALSVWLSLGKDAGQRVLALSVGSVDIAALFVAGSIWIIANVLKRASELAPGEAIKYRVA